LSGLDGNDEIDGGRGNDVLLGGSGDDWLNGHMGADQLTGGPGADTFYFQSPSATTLAEPDHITDFEWQNDVIDLSDMDANSTLAGDQAFTFIGQEGFHGVAGELRFEAGLIKGDLDGDRYPDFIIEVDFALQGPAPVSGIGTPPPAVVQTLHASDFIL
jgi:serralysin